MTTPIYGVKIEDGKMVGDLFPVYPFIWTASGSSEVGGVQLTMLEIGRALEFTDPNFIASLPLTYPAGVILSEDNWAGLFHEILSHKQDMTFRLKNKSLAIRRGFSSAEGLPSFGYYYFEIKSINLGTVGILVDRPEGTKRPYRKLSQVLVINDLEPKYESLHEIYYNDEEIAVGPRSSMNLSGEGSHRYSISFRYKLTPEQIMKIYIEGIDSIELTEDLFDNSICDPIDQYFTPSGRVRSEFKKRLVYRSVGGINYLSSIDGKFKIFLQKDFISKAFIAARRIPWEKGGDPNIDRTKRDSLIGEYITHVDYHFNNLDKPDETLGRLLEFLSQ